VFSLHIIVAHTFWQFVILMIAGVNMDLV